MNETIYYAGTEAEVLHHAGPLLGCGNVVIAQPDQIEAVAAPGDLVVFYSEHFDRFRDLCVILKQRRIPTVYAIDGILEWRNAWENRQDEIACPWTMRPCLSDVVACIGESQRRVLRYWGNRQPIVSVGIPRLDGWKEHGIAASASAKNVSAGNDRSPEALNVLVLTARCPGFTDQQVATTGESLQAIARVLARQPVIAGRTVQLTWRLTGGLDEALGVRSDHQTTLRELLEQSDVVVGTASTALLESMLLVKPTVLLDFHNTPAYLPTAWAIRHEDQILPVLLEITELPAGHPKMGMQEMLLDDALNYQGSATDRLWDLLQQVREHAEKQRQLGQWNFRDCVPQLSESLVGHSGASPEAEVDAHGMDLQQWQTYGEQLRRENQRLKVLVQEAHQVFDHMQGHPVLGSILKTHKWFQERVLRRADRMSKPSDLEGDR